MLTLKICDRVFSDSIKARILELGICLDDELLDYGIDTQAHCYHYFLYLSIFLSFQGKFVSRII